MLGLDRFELAHEPVVVDIGYRRLVEHVVAIIRFLDLRPQVGGALFGSGGFHPRSLPAVACAVRLHDACKKSGESAMAKSNWAPFPKPDKAFDYAGDKLAKAWAK